MAFPNLSVPPSQISPDGSLALDPTIRSQSEAGYELTRARFTRQRRKWGIRYDILNDADMALLRAFEAAQQVGALSFTWTHPVSSTVYTVRFAGPISGPDVSKGGINMKISFELVQV